ncbi:hypothetical protein NEUTE2DRAFT_123596 [Neurospora tetrasperma FGSC 2509]|nr:hypothetical protein NEUTE2DRAFT_123596 [Neurospora tetrasperma FGSC 2509]
MLSGYGAEPLSDDTLKRSLTAFSTPTRQEGLKEEGARRIATIIQNCPVTPTEKYRRYMPTTNPAQASCKRDHAKGDSLVKLNMARKGPVTKTNKNKVVGLTEPM